MPLAEYLASEQAREDVRQLFDGDKPRFPVMSMEDLCLVRDEVGAWRSVMIWDDNQNKELTAYYRPDGDRYVVTDLGEGVRALRIRTGAKYIDILQKCRRTTRHNHFYGAFGQIYDATIGAGNWERGSGIGALFDASTEADKANLPDAICRVMLASLKVAEVQP